MENNKDNAAEKETSTESTLERGKKAIEADDKLTKKDLNNPEVKKEKEKDAEQWHNEG